MLLTIIIFSTTFPFVRSTSSVLLQGVPLGVSIDTVRDRIQKISGIVSVHELHVWQLSNAKHVASVHIRLLPSVDYMSLITNVKYILHTYGIHSTTIQPEFGDLENNESSCLLRCEDESCVQKLCCSTPQTN
ncbi:cation efflux protein [Gigaspora margarita]|uniref:Cation efflux protein n=1 Tax=Gigaspora margarita TaxID=4874 RepID=A0A8H3X5P9_GIGMA|nr:cation efflux protein [Gigaspora margarita]